MMMLKIINEKNFGFNANYVIIKILKGGYENFKPPFMKKLYFS